MANKLDSKLQERIKEEMRLAQEHGFTVIPQLPIIDNFRAEGLTAVPYSHLSGETAGQPVSFMHQGTSEGILAGPNPFKPRTDAKTLTEVIRKNLEAINDNNHRILVPQLLDQFADLAAQTDDYSKIEALHKAVLEKAFGDAYFKNSHGGANK